MDIINHSPTPVRKLNHDGTNSPIYLEGSSFNEVPKNQIDSICESLWQQANNNQELPDAQNVLNNIITQLKVIDPVGYVKNSEAITNVFKTSGLVGEQSARPADQIVGLIAGLLKPK